MVGDEAKKLFEAIGLNESVSVRWSNNINCLPSCTWKTKLVNA